ncbi:uncharacterized protein LOC126234244 [Schistocerca nitens]|uniref:uncharacterized protein LOC126234244 n=1 Tax=Schistocerca nitens TaxID=7011 RepID=UPI0021197E37|nr:uncharacterized protein LOC126234244 [Schistocerca nitens]
MAFSGVAYLLLASSAAFFSYGLAAPTTVAAPPPEAEEAVVAAVSLDAEAPAAANRSQSAVCTVAGVEYEHGQQVARADPCELCLCLAGDLFCWWQDCPTASPACRQSPAFAAACAAVAENSSMALLGGSPGPDVVTEAAAWPTTAAADVGDDTADVDAAASSSDSTPPAGVDGDNSSDTAAPPPPAPASTAPTACHVMGTEYKIGEVLPRDTGTCLECVCDSEARVTCSPKNCASHDDFHAANSLDMFDVDTF